MPSLKDRFDALIAAPSASRTQPELDQTNRPAIGPLTFWLGDLGFRYEIREISPGKFSLLASHGSDPGELMLAGYTDTVSYDEALWSNNPLRLDERDGRWYGPGSYDIKDFFPLAIEALLPLLDQPFRQPLTILATCDEESPMAGAHALAESGRPPGRVTVISEPTSPRPIRLYKGMMMECIEIPGQNGHSSDPNFGRSTLEVMRATIDELMALCGEWQQAWSNPQFSMPQPVLNFGCTHGGDSPNRICSQRSLKLNLRLLPGVQPKQLREAIRQCLQPLTERHEVGIDYQPLFPAVPPLEQTQDNELIRVAERLAGHRAEAVAFGTEAPYFQHLSSETLVPGAGNIACVHQPDEHLELARIEPMVGMLRRLIQHYCLTPAAD